MSFARYVTLVALAFLLVAISFPSHASQSVPPDVGQFNYGYNRCDVAQYGYASRSQDEQVGADAYYGNTCHGAVVTTANPWATDTSSEAGACGGDNYYASYYLGVETYSLTDDAITYTYGSGCTSTATDGLTLYRKRAVSCPSGYTPNSTTNLCDPPVGIDPNKTNGKGNGSCGCDSTDPAFNNGSEPINSATGALFEDETDFVDPGTMLTVERYYSSANGQFDLTNLGPQWRNNFDRRIGFTVSGTGTVSGATAFRANGNRYHFIKNSSGQWISDLDVAIVLTSSSDGSGNITGWTLADIDGTKETYDANGYLINITKQDERTVTLTYSGIYLSQVVDERNRVLAFHYAPITYQNLTELTEIDTPDGLSIKYQYDSNTGMLTSVNYSATVNGQAVTQSKTYVYGENGAPSYALTGLVDEAGQRHMSWSYDAQGRATLSVLGASTEYPGRTELTYNGDGSTSIKNWIDGTANLGTTRQFSFNTIQGVPHIASVTCTTCQTPAAIQLPGFPALPASSTFDPSGYLKSSSDYNNNLTTTQYDDTYGLLNQQVEASGTANQRTTNTNWDAVLRKPLLRTVLDAQNNMVSKTAWIYNYLGELHVRCDIDPAVSYTCVDTGTPPAGVRRWIYHYCGSVDTTQCPVIGLLLTVDGPRTDVSDVWTYAYYMLDGVNHHHGDLQSITDPLGHVTTYLTYDGAGRVLSQQDANGVYTDFTYTPRGWLQTRTIRVTPDNSAASSDATTTIAYTPYGSVASITDPDGVFVSYKYDNAHRLTDVYDALNKHIHYTLNAVGQATLEQTFTASGTVVRSLGRQFNALGQLTSVTDGQSHTIFGAGYSDSYDANGNLTHSVDGLSVQRQQGFDALNRLVSALDNYNGTDAATSNTLTKVQPDALNRLAGVTDPNGLATSYTFDGLSNRTKLQSPDTGTSTDTFDAAGNRLVHTDAKGIVSTSAYDADNRITGTTYADSTLNVSYKYDEANSVTGCAASKPIGRLTRIIENGVSTTYCYGGHGNIGSKTQAASGHTDTTLYGYTSADRLQSVTSPDNTVVGYTYNANGLLASVQLTPSGSSSAPATIVSNVSWLPFGPISSYVLGNGQTITKTYDANYRLTDITSPAFNLHLARDVMGDVSAVGPASGANPASETYNYDALYRLSSLMEANGTTLESYTYNQTGDRLTKSASGLATGSYVYNSGTHQLKTIGNASQASDANGNTTGSVIGGGTYGYAYNGRNRLSLAQLNGSTVATYTYNALGQRIGKVTSTAERYGYNEGSQLIAEYGATNRDYIWLGSLPVAVVDNTINGSVTTSTVNYVVADQLGTPRAVTNASGTTIWQWAYQGNPFGEQVPTSSSGYVLNLRYPGQYFDAESGTNYNMFRTYQPATGRYLQSDPAGLGGGISTYGYVAGNPLRYVDSFGLAGVDPPDEEPSAAPPPAVAEALKELADTEQMKKEVEQANGPAEPNYPGAYQPSEFGPTGECKRPGSNPEVGPPNGEHSGYRDITLGNSVRNVQTDVGRGAFEDALVDSGYSQSVSKDGNVNIYTNGDTTYTTRATSLSTGGPTAEVFQGGQLVLKIRLGGN